MNESWNNHAVWKKLDLSLHWEQLSCWSPSLPEKVHVYQICLHALASQEHFSAAELATFCSSAQTARDTANESLRMGSLPYP